MPNDVSLRVGVGRGLVPRREHDDRLIDTTELRT